MKVLNPTLLAAFRVPGHCEICGKWCKRRCGHHIFSKGAGQVDIPENLICVGFDNPYICNCHAAAENGTWLGHRIGIDACRWLCIWIAATAEGKRPEETEDVIFRVRRDRKAKEWKLDRVSDRTRQRLAGALPVET